MKEVYIYNDGTLWNLIITARVVSHLIVKPFCVKLKCSADFWWCHGKNPIIIWFWPWLHGTFPTLQSNHSIWRGYSAQTFIPLYSIQWTNINGTSQWECQSDEGKRGRGTMIIYSEMDTLCWDWCFVLRLLLHREVGIQIDTLCWGRCFVLRLTCCADISDLYRG
jgi:hypothetical protein